jgi:hypothetical protein
MRRNPHLPVAGADGPLGDKQYYYEVKARWQRDGQPVTEERVVDAIPGKTATVTFTGTQPSK